MNVKELIGLFKVGKVSAKSHMRNLMEIAVADGSFGNEEQRLLQYAALRNNISESQLKEIQANTNHISFEVPKNEEEKFFQLYDLVHMMCVDETIHAEELRLCEIFAIKFGYRQQVVREMIELIRHNIKNWIGPKETMKNVFDSMKVY